MMISEASKTLEKLCQPRQMYMHELRDGIYRHLTPVVTEYACSTAEFGPDGDFEFFRARAVHPNVQPDDFDPLHNQVSVTICHQTHAVKFGPIGRVLMDPESKKLGSGLMACVIGWLSTQNVGHYSVDPGRLAWIDASNDPNRLRRNKFYAAFGFTLAGATG